LHQRLIQVSTVDERFDILINALKDRLPESFDYHPAVSYALQAFRRQRCATIASVAKETGLGQRKFIQIFSEQVGFRPKLFLRMERFQRVLGQIARAAAINWGDVVEQNGYYDQSHFINDFEDFSGLSPGAYLHCRGPHQQHVPIPRA
jgi:AraC-like DNA-binding protein